MLKIFCLVASMTIFLNTQNVFSKEIDVNFPSEFLVQIKNHRFEPSEIKVPANKKFTLIVENLDSTLEEFESDDLKKEKLVSAGKKITLPINGLAAGEYKFYGDFHQKTAQGKIIVK